MDIYKELDQLHMLLPEEDIRRGETLIRPGDTERWVYFIQKGAFRIFRIISDEEYITRLAYSGEAITALDSFINQSPTQYFIEAIRSAKIRKCSLSDYRKFLASSPEGLHFWEAQQSALILQQMERELDLQIERPAERVTRVLARSPRLFEEIPLKYIAHYLRMTPETLSRVLNS